MKSMFHFESFGFLFFQHIRSQSHLLAQEELDKLKTQDIANIERNKTEPQYLVQKRLGEINQTYPKGHPLYNMSMEEELAAINEVTIEAMQAYYDDFYGISNNATLVAIGNIEEEGLKNYFEKEYADFKSELPYSEIKDPFRPNNPANEQIKTPDKKNAFTLGFLNFECSQYDEDYAALQVVKMGADSVTIHLREDRRHINDLDAKKICKAKKVLVNLEISMNDKIVDNALKIKPNYVCLVPENRKEITTEGGLNLVKHKKKLKYIIEKFKKKKIRTSLFINPSIKDIVLSKELNVDCVEIHTGKISNIVKAKKKYANELNRIQEPFNRLSFGSNILAQTSPFGGTQTQTISPLAQNNPFATALGAAGQAYGLGSLIKQ